MTELEYIELGDTLIDRYKNDSVACRLSVACVRQQNELCRKCIEEPAEVMLCGGYRKMVDINATQSYGALSTFLYECEKGKKLNKKDKLLVIASKSHIPEAVLHKYMDSELCPKLEGPVWTSSMDKAMKYLVSELRRGVQVKAMHIPTLLRSRMLYSAVDAAFDDSTTLGILQYDVSPMSQQQFNIIKSEVDKRIAFRLPMIITTSTDPVLRGDYEQEFYDMIGDLNEL